MTEGDTEQSMSKLHFLLEYRHHMDRQMSHPAYSDKREEHLHLAASEFVETAENKNRES